MPELIYTSRNHNKTIMMVDRIIKHVDSMQRLNSPTELSFYQGSNEEYHLGYIIEVLNDAGYRVDTSMGKCIINLYITKKG